MVNPPPRRLVSWSPSLTLVPTRSYFNACSYCSFRRPHAAPQPLASRRNGPALAKPFCHC